MSKRSISDFFALAPKKSINSVSNVVASASTLSSVTQTQTFEDIEENYDDLGFNHSSNESDNELEIDFIIGDDDDQASTDTEMHTENSD